MVRRRGDPRGRPSRFGRQQPVVKSLWCHRKELRRYNKDGAPERAKRINEKLSFSPLSDQPRKAGQEYPIREDCLVLSYWVVQ